MARNRSHRIIVTRLFHRSTSAPTIGASAVGMRVATPILLTSRAVVSVAAAASTSANNAMLCSRSPSCDTVCPMTRSVNSGRFRTPAIPPGAGFGALTEVSGRVTLDPVGLENEPLVWITTDRGAHSFHYGVHEPIAFGDPTPLGDQRWIELDQVPRLPTRISPCK